MTQTVKNAVKTVFNTAKRIPQAMLFVMLGLSFLAGNFFVLRTEAYLMPYVPLFAGLLDKIEGGVYFYMTVSAFLDAALGLLIVRAAVSFTAFTFGFQIDKKLTTVYLEIFIIIANLFLSVFGVLFVKYPYILYGLVSIIRFFFLSIGYVLFGYQLTKDTVPKKHSKRFYARLAYLYFALSLSYGALSFSLGGLL